MLNLTTPQKIRITKYVKIIGIGIMLTYVTVGFVAMSTMPEEVTKEFWFFKAFGDESIEGVNYKVSLSDGIDGSDTLR